MNLFKNLFEKKEKKFTPDNTKLLALIAQYHKDSSSDSYAKVIEELYGDEACLIVPTADENSKSNEWKTLKKGEAVNFTSVFDIDGLLAFGVFTSEETLSKWITKETPFMAMPAKSVLEISEQQSFGRVVIDSDQPTMFVLERNRENFNAQEIKEDTDVLVGTPIQPIDGAHKTQLQNAFSKNNNIEEVFHFAMQRKEESILILAFVLEQYSENARVAVMNNVNDGMQGVNFNQTLEIMYITKEDSWYETARNFDYFYKKK
ncbi:SseB family protein [Flavobacterium sp. F372]|uniref:SseB family protein n=1 Tax=Flavobacterium bernardetii TaxID=2813823 RepID=A0ABR7IVK2_9FLAO|nr:SseB family protein [Flavobacterium bernardetii]MBC5833689.1 SseB family protein [Flavobacterium bernardetii]NHF68922.1 SseB family protein [Flavobacterium bernardetii]